MVALFATVVLGQTKIEIKPAELPGCTMEWVKVNMQNYTIDKAFKIDNKGVITYLARVTMKAETKVTSQWLSVDKECKNTKKVADPKPEPAPAPKPKPQPKQRKFFINDQIARCLAGVPMQARPVFLKIVYHGPAALEELVNHDSSLVVGILGGSSGTTYDAFKLIAEAQKYGARAATFGRKIKNAEDPLTFVEMLRHIVDGDLTPKQAVKSYHSAIKSLKLTPGAAWKTICN